MPMCNCFEAFTVIEYTNIALSNAKSCQSRALLLFGSYLMTPMVTNPPTMASKV
jgi:hypothetical protein